MAQVESSVWNIGEISDNSVVKRIFHSADDVEVAYHMDPEQQRQSNSHYPHTSEVRHSPKRDLLYSTRFYSQQVLRETLQNERHNWDNCGVFTKK